MPTKEEATAAAIQLQNSDPTTPTEWILDLLNILAKAGDPSYAAVVEPFLHSKNDTIAETALEVLGVHWKITEPYRDLILQWIDGAPSDLIGTQKLMAVRVAGYHLERHSDPVMLAKLIDILENGSDDVDRSAAYEAILLAMAGRAAWIAYVRADHNLPWHDLDRRIDPGVIQAAKERLAREANAT